MVKVAYNTPILTELYKCMLKYIFFYILKLSFLSSLLIMYVYTFYL